MKKLILILTLIVSTQLMANGLDLDIGGNNPFKPDSSSDLSCPDLSDFDWSSGDINDFLDRIQKVQDRYSRGIETHAREGLKFGKLKLQEASYMEMATAATDINLATNILIELNPQQSANTINRLKTFVGLKIMSDGIGEYKSYINTPNYKVCLSAKDLGQHKGLLETVNSIITTEGSLTELENCPSDQLEIEMTKNDTENQ